MSVAQIDFTHPLSTPERLAQVFQLVDHEMTVKELARTLRGMASESAALADLIDPPADEGFATFAQVGLGSFVKVAGEWRTVYRKDLATDFDGVQHRRLYVAANGEQAWWYEMGDDEAVPVELPF